MAPAQMMERLSSLEAEKTALYEEVTQLRAQIEWFKKNLYGTGKSEKLDALQTRLKLDEDAIKPPETPVTETITYDRKKTTKREPAAERFADLPVNETIELLPAEVQARPDLYERIGAEETFEVRITAPKLWKRKIVRPRFRHKLDRSVPPLLALAPARVIEGGYASAQLIAYIALNKYLYHLPLYRQEKMSAHWGARISRKTMTDWIEVVAKWFNPIYGLMRQNLLQSGNSTHTRGSGVKPGLQVKNYALLCAKVIFRKRYTCCNRSTQSSRSVPAPNPNSVQPANICSASGAHYSITACLERPSWTII